MSAEVDRVIEAAAAEPGVRPDGMFDNVYERPPARVLKQREQFRGSNGNA